MLISRDLFVYMDGYRSDCLIFYKHSFVYKGMQTEEM